jgi:hypothetical protein
MLLKILSFALYTNPLSLQALAKQIMPVLRILCYNGSLVTSTIVRLTAAKFKPLIFSISRFAFSYIANMLILIILYNLCFLPAQFCLLPYQFCNLTHKANNEKKNCILKPSCCSLPTQRDSLITSMTTIIRTAKLNLDLMSQH